MDFLRQNFLLLIPLVLLQLGLQIAGLVDLARRERVAGGRKWVWVLVILLLSTIGPLVYFAVGRSAAFPGVAKVKGRCSQAETTAAKR